MTQPKTDASVPLRIDEIKKYVNSRYCGCCEAVWRIHGFPMQSRYPPVERLQVHDKDLQRIVYEEHMEAAALQDPRNERTKLTAYFDQCTAENEQPLTDTERGYKDSTELLPSAAELTYSEFPMYYTWHDDTRTWKRRKSPHKRDTIGRMHSIHAKAGDKFFLRMLLTKIRGATSFDSLRQGHATYKEACIAMGLLADDEEWRETMSAAALSQTNINELRDLFVVILYENHPSNPTKL